MLTGYYAPKGFEKDLEVELSLRSIPILVKYDRLFVSEVENKNVVFAQDIWFDLQKVSFSSISDGAQKIKEFGKRFYHYPYKNMRRAELILEKLPRTKNKRYDFLEKIPEGDLSPFFLIDETTAFVAKRTNHTIPFGEIEFNEDKINPPSRAYLKLWELFTVYGIAPSANAKVMDLGACPGGWTWVLAGLNCDVLSVDKAPLDPKIMELSNVEFLQESAFGLRPTHVGKKDWLYSDIICYPHKLLELVHRWRESGLVDNFACTIKFQEPTDFETMFKFQEIPNSKIVHLSCNKHEVTWILKKPLN